MLQPCTSQNQPKKAIEDIYQKKSQLEHILLRPDTYIGADPGLISYLISIEECVVHLVALGAPDVP